MIKQSLLLLTLLIYIGCGLSDQTTNKAPTTGQSGSRAQYAIVGDYLYTVNSGVMDIFDISDASQPTPVSKVRLPWDVETLFAYKDYLYIGAESGIYIYDNSIPIQPTSIAKFSHVQSCDPVVVSDDIAYVTLNTESRCWDNRTGVNRLEMLDVRDPKNPKLIKTLDMWAPTGLGVDGNKLFICDGKSGLKAFEVTKNDNNGSIAIDLDIKSSNTEINCYDVIAHKDSLIVSNSDEIRQFDYSSFPMEELGRIK